LVVLVRLTGALGPSTVVAALFALHPLHVESVAWIAERKDVLSGFFWMLSLWLYLQYVQRPSAGRMMLLACSFAAGLMSKPMLVSLPVVLLLLDFWPLERVAPDEIMRASRWWPLVREKLPLFALAAASGVVTFTVQRDAGAVVGLDQLPLRFRVENGLVSYAAYVRDTFWPSRLAVFYPFVAPKPASVALAVAPLVVVTIAVAKVARRMPYLTVGWVWYLVTLVPVIGLFQAGGQARADRFTYLPSIGLFIAIVWGAAAAVKRLPYRTLVGGLAAGAAVSACAVATARQLRYWKNDLALWGRAVQVTEKNYRAENHFGVALSNAGKLDEAITHYSAALTIWPGYAEAHNNLGTARVDQGRTDDAIREFSEAARLKPQSALFHYNLGVALGNAGRNADAVREMEAALKLNPSDPQIRRAMTILAPAPER
jgi:hypothetical protein